MSTFCEAVRSGLATGPQAGFCNGSGSLLGSSLGQSTTANTAPPSTDYSYQQPPPSTTYSYQQTLPSTNYPPPTILSQSTYNDSIGTLHIVGEVVNQSPVTAKFVEIIATLYNAYNHVIGTQFT